MTDSTFSPLPRGSEAAGEPVIRPVIAVAGSWPDFALLDSGDGQKLERYGPYTVVRPEPQAMWRPRLPVEAWDKADAVFSGDVEEEGPGRWRMPVILPESFPMAYGPAQFLGRFTSFRHMGLFPEQHTQWDHLIARIQACKHQPKVLNLFGYTGVASLLAAAAGAHVTHVDASKKAIGWARENQARSGLDDKPIRWICEDARRFVEREGRRGNRYDFILLDPPKFGRGPKGEEWHLFRDLPPMLEAVEAVLADGPSELILTVYAIRASFLAFHETVAETFARRGGSIVSGELAIREEGSGRLMPTANFVRWTGPGEGETR
ncbi:class I SAM-dependent methyltransferase [Segnochrobactraceae bacterium EtOH-i3]